MFFVSAAHLPRLSIVEARIDANAPAPFRPRVGPPLGILSRRDISANQRRGRTRPESAGDRLVEIVGSGYRSDDPRVGHVNDLSKSTAVPVISLAAAGVNGGKSRIFGTTIAAYSPDLYACGSVR